MTDNDTERELRMVAAIESIARSLVDLAALEIKPGELAIFAEVIVLPTLLSDGPNELMRRCGRYRQALLGITNGDDNGE